MKIKLNKDFYSIDAVKDALDDFKEVCEGRIMDGSMEIELEPKGDIKGLKDEFCNYVLGLMQNKG